MRRDQKAAKKKKAREKARVTARASSALPTIAKMATMPFGPCWLTRSWRSTELPPHLVSAIITRDYDGMFAAHVMLVDRTCLGVKDAFTVGPLGERELLELAHKVGESHPDGIESASLEDTRSVVFAALAYASRLGFRPSPDLDTRLIGPPPEELRDTPLANQARPYYYAGPNDDVPRVLATLERAVGPDGFDVVSEDDRPEARPDEQEITAALATAFRTLAPEVPPEGKVAFGQFLRSLGEENELPEEHATSLPGFWATVFRPLEDGTRGIEIMRAEHPDDGAFAALAKTRATLFEVLAVEGPIGVCRDVITDERLLVRLDEMAPKATRWLRFFGYLTPMDDGTYYPPSTLLGHPWLRNVDVAVWLAKVNELLTGLGVKEQIDAAAPTRGLARWGALAHGVLTGLIAPTEEQRPRPLYVVNSDGDRFELHEATFALARAVKERLLEALAHADDFVASDGFAWMREPKAKGVIDGEHAASIDTQGDGAVKVTANSAERFAAVKARLEVLAGVSLEPSGLALMRPWEHVPNAVAEETAETRRIVFGAAQAPAGAGVADVKAVALASLRRALDEEVPMLGGRPRDLVREPDGRTRVERWLQDQELLGMPGGEAPFLDLDVLRRDLGLPTVIESLPRRSRASARS